MNALQNYSRFTTSNPGLDFSFLYPSDWQIREVKGKEYEEVFIRGPRNKENTYSLSLVVRVAAANANFDTRIADYLGHIERLNKFRELSRATGALAGAEAAEIEVGYAMPLPINSVNAKETLVIERIIFLKRGDRLYEIAYKGVEEDYYRYLEAFRNAARTFEFLGTTSEQADWPIVTSAPAYALRERRSEYKADGQKI